MSKASEDLINEYLNERNEVFENEKNRLAWIQCWHSIGGLSSILMLGVRNYFLSWLCLTVLLLCFIDEQTIAIIRAASNEEILNGIRSFNAIALILTGLSVCLILVVRSQRFFRSAKQEWVDAEDKFADDVKNIVLIGEELLRRHKLISESESVL